MSAGGAFHRSNSNATILDVGGRYRKEPKNASPICQSCLAPSSNFVRYHSTTSILLFFKWENFAISTESNNTNMEILELPKETGHPKQHMFSSKIPTGEPLPMIMIKLEMDFYLLLGPRIGLTILGDKFAASQLFDWHTPQNSTFLIRIIPYGLCFLEALTILSPLFFDEI